MKILTGLLLTAALFLTGCATTGQVRKIQSPPPPRVVVVYPEYYTPMYIHWRFDIGRGWHHYHHHHYPRYRR